MEITRGSLDDISRPASSELTGSRVSSVSLSQVDRTCCNTPLSLVVLTNDAADIQDQSSSNPNIINSSSPDQGQYHADATDEENGDSKLQEATEEMRRLEEILAAKTCKEKEVKRQGKELKEKLWQELLQNKPKCRSECAHEAMNTRLFLALEAPSGPKEEADFMPVFGTQVPEQEYDRDSRHTEQNEKKPASTIESFEAGHEETGQEQSEGSHCGASKDKKKEKDFVKKNIELASGMGGQVLMTQAERERLAELLREVEEEEEDSARGADSEEDMRAVSVLTGQGYSPEPSHLEQLIDIDSRIRLLLPAEEFLSVQSSYTNLSVSQGRESEAGWELDGDPQPGEKVLQDIRERRGQERRLQEIQQQLEILGQGQEMTVSSKQLCSSPTRSSLLDECELMQRWSQDVERGDTTPWDPNGDTDTPLPDALLSELLQGAYTTSFSRLESGTCAE
uniref:fibrous sheath-interacting protein 1 n=1 Tax=Centroberyx gerrardi TaxID=166262 RepID=UPI003AB075F1